MNCAAVQIGEGSGDTTTPTNPAKPSVSATKPTTPSSSAYQPAQPDEEDQYSEAPVPTSTRAAGSPSYPTVSASPTQPDDETSSEEPSYETPSEDDSEETDDSENYEDSSEEESNYDSEEHDNKWSDNKWSDRGGRWNSHRNQTAKYKIVDKHRCKITSKRADCVCMASSGCTPEQREPTERKALRMHRRDAYKKRADACAWDSAPSMVVSYYTVDAACAPNAKMNVPESDTFEIGWMEPCGVVEGDGEYPIKDMDCNMFS